MSRRVLFVIGSGNLGGTEQQLGTLVRMLQQRGWEPGVAFMAAGGPVTDAIDQLGVPTWVQSPPIDDRGTMRLASVPRAVANAARFAHVVRRATRELRPTFVHALLPTSVWIGLPASRGGPAHRIAGIRGYTPRQSRPIASLYGHELRGADAVVCNAPHLAEEMVEEWGVDPLRVRVIPNGVDVPGWSADPTPTPPTGVAVANFQTYKGYDVLLDALALMDTPVTIRLCGTGPQRDAMRDRALVLGVTDRAVFVDPPADVPAELRQAQLAVHPSLTEGLPNAILEQMAAGLPVIASDVGGIPLLVEHGVNGLLVPPGDAAALAKALTALASDPALRARMGTASKQRAEQFSWDTCTQAHIDLYTELTQAPTP